MQRVRRLYYFSFPTKIGQLFAAVSNQGVLQLCFERQDALARFKELAIEFEAPIARVEVDQVNAVGRQLIDEVHEYLAGERREFSVQVEASPSLTEFQEKVYKHLQEIEYGQTESYLEVARLVEAPGSARAVGSACANNRIPLIFPCHRVVRTDGSIGEFGGGTDVKRFLLDLEAGVTSKAQT
ncbi:methylated-DNA--[protein]-cysteine S-methyltransferase [Micrococcoides hystricis]|uniref:Methylated-DNA--[protein]-cysteine S-methyltransferase n=1 Tax=Micrococcoides hystricis TaxID=1572761 RepID=A0ABV6PBB5_9MICC